MKLSVVFATPHLSPLPELARIAEASGYFRAWTTEFPNRDALIRCAVLAGCTSTLSLGTGIAYNFVRHPLMLAAAALDLQEASGGRFALGLGTGTRGMRSRWFGMHDPQPVARMRESVELVRAAATATGSVSFHGQYFDVEVDGINNADRFSGDTGLPIYGSGFNSRMMIGALRWTDGILLHPMLAGTLGQLHLATAREAAGATEPRWCSQWIITSVHADDDRARALARQSMAFYLCTPSYANRLEDSAWADVPVHIASRFKQVGPNWPVLATAIPDDMLDEHCISGSPARALDQLARFEDRLAASGVHELVLQIAVTDQDVTSTSESISTALKGLARK